MKSATTCIGSMPATPQARINLGIRRRLAPLLGNNRRRIELMNGLLFSLPGTPVIYYGDEIGMGDNIYLGDRNGVRTPMQWSADRNAGFSRANPQKLYLPVIIDPEYHYEAVNVEAQQHNPNSLLWWMKRLIALRKRFKAFGRGTLSSCIRTTAKCWRSSGDTADENMLVVANLSRFVQYVELDLAAFKGMVPVELFGRTPFPPVGDTPYPLTLGSARFYLVRAGAAAESRRGRRPGAIAAPCRWARHGRSSSRAEPKPPERAAAWTICAAALVRRQGRGASRTPASRNVPAQSSEGIAFIVLRSIAYGEGDALSIPVPLTFVEGEVTERVRRDHPAAVLAHFAGRAHGLLYRCAGVAEFCRDICSRPFAHGEA